MITIDGKRYKVIETLAYHQFGTYAKYVMDGNRERVAIKEFGEWRFWTPADITKPLVDWIEKQHKELRDEILSHD